MKELAYHIPALLKETVNGLNINPSGVYVDVTFGGGGHSREILSRLDEKGRLYGFDQDEDALRNKPQDNRFTFVLGNFRYIKNFLRYYNIDSVDGILADLGVSFHHFDDVERGFSFRFDGNLDMRMNQHGVQTAASIINSYEEERLANVFYLYGELNNSRRIARKICDSRKINSIDTVSQLMEVVGPLFARDRSKKELSCLFQALRIEVNGEMDALREMLMQTTRVLKKGGRLSILTYHSLEDRMVKNFMKTGNFEGKMEKDFYGNPITPFIQINGKPMIPSEVEIEHNPRSRSAKLRIAEKR